MIEATFTDDEFRRIQACEKACRLLSTEALEANIVEQLLIVLGTIALEKDLALCQRRAAAVLQQARAGMKDPRVQA